MDGFFVLTGIIGLAFGVVIASLFYYTMHKKKINEAKSTSSNFQNDLKKIQNSEHILRDEIKMLQSKLQHTFEDPITKLGGWQLFEDRLSHSIKESDRSQLPLAVLFVDVDNFKMINDAINYDVGDALLKEVAQRLKSCVRQVDTVSRFAKDTFVVLLTQLIKPETAAIVAQRIMQSVMEPFRIAGHELSVTVCIGIAICPTDGHDAATLLRSADHALHLAKEKGNHIYQFYQEKMHNQSRRELILNNSLSQDTIFNDFILYFSPILDAKKNKISFMESLLHWQQTEMGLVGPEELFLYAERQRKLNLVSEWLLRNAGKHYLYWKTIGFQPEYLIIPVTIKQFENTHFIYRISQILQDINFNPASLIIEINEMSQQIPFAVLEKAFNMLKYLGVKIMVNDFGKGSFPLTYLKSFSIQYLKLDPMLINDLEENEMTVKLITALKETAHSLNMQIICQGVERESQKQILSQIGYTLFEGSLVSQSLTAKEVNEKMAVPT